MESSIAAFDPVVSGGFNWFQNHRPQNTKGVLGILFSPISRDEGFNYNTQITKFSAVGGRLVAAAAGLDAPGRARLLLLTALRARARR